MFALSPFCTILSRFSKVFVFFSLLTCSLYSQEQEKEMDQPIHFVRDIMQPLGTPIVTSFHRIRESQFLNMHVKHAKGLEAVGDFFLAPSRYLFAGKTVKVAQKDPAQYELEQSFHYRKMHWLKTTFALAVLPVSEVIGVTLKGMAYLSPKIRKKHRLIRSALKASLAHSPADHYHDIDISPLHSDDYVPCLHYKRPSKMTKKQRAEIQAFKDIITLLEQNNIVYWADFGTCLGAYRYGGIIPWDWDIDISILLPDHNKVKRILSQLDPKKYQVQDWSSYSNPGTLLKVFVKRTKNFIDITHYSIDIERKEVSYFFTYRDSPFPHSWKKDELKGLKPVKFETLFPLKKAIFDGITVRAPNDVVTYLKSKYDGDLEPSNIWDEEAQCYRKITHHPYWSK